VFEDDGIIPPTLRVAPDDPHWRAFNGPEVSKTDRADNSVAAIAAEGAALTVDTDNLETAPPSTALAVVPVNPEPARRGAQTDLYRRAAQSWHDLKETQRYTWEHYIVIGEGMVAARAEIMRKLGRNDPSGPAYQDAFKAWLVEYGLADMDKAARTRLIKLIGALPEVNEMMSGWSDQERRKRNHPNAIYRALEKWRLAHGQPTEIRPKKPTSNGRNELLQKIDQLRAHIADIEAARERETAATATNPAEPIDIVVEADRSAENEIVGSLRKKMTPSAARRGADRAEHKRYQRLESTVFQISEACENNEELELPMLTAAERDGAVAKLEASATHLNELIGRVKTASISAERDRQHD
jgi:hypothetical protein